MIWIILVVLFFGISIWSSMDEGYEMWWAFVVFFIPLAIMMLMGTATYPDLKGQREAIVSLQNRVSDIRGSYYTSQKTPNAVVGGSIENIKQSTVLSNYISSLANKEAEYNNEVEKVKAYMKSRFVWWVGYSMFVSDEIYKLEPIRKEK